MLKVQPTSVMLKFIFSSGLVFYRLGFLKQWESSEIAEWVIKS